MIKSRTIIATPPGYTIKEQLEQRGMTQKEFAFRMDMSEKHISHLINGEVRLTPNVAVRLEAVLGVPSEFWNNLEAIYQSKKQKAEEENAMDADIEIMKKMPYSEIAKLGWIEFANRAAEKVKKLRRFFEVAYLTIIDRTPLTGIAYRILGSKTKSKYVKAVWVQKARLTARERKVSGINLQGLSSKLSELRELMFSPEDELFIRLSEILSECGIAFVMLPALKGSFLHGASFIDGKKIVMALTLRGNYTDKFWFSFFHEIGHILKGHIAQTEGLTQVEEQEADEFSENILIPLDLYKKFVKADNFNVSSVKEFADRVNVDAGVVVGRLQTEGHIGFDEMNSLRKQYHYA